jgi:hypothetical protein
MQIGDADLKRYARVGAIQEIVDDRQKHARIDAMLPGTLAAAIRQLRAKDHGAPDVVELVEQVEPTSLRRKRKPLSATARKRIGIAKRRWWREHRKEQKKAS